MCSIGRRLERVASPTLWFPLKKSIEKYPSIFFSVVRFTQSLSKSSPPLTIAYSEDRSDHRTLCIASRLGYVALQIMLVARQHLSSGNRLFMIRKVIFRSVLTQILLFGWMLAPELAHFVCVDLPDRTEVGCVA